VDDWRKRVVFHQKMNQRKEVLIRKERLNNQPTDELVNYYRNKSDEWLLKYRNLLTPHARKEVKQAYNIVLKERELK
jgi:hypothetical protein